jgi:hypothetical protein
MELRKKRIRVEEALKRAIKLISGEMETTKTYVLLDSENVIKTLTWEIENEFPKYE